MTVQFIRSCPWMTAIVCFLGLLFATTAAAQNQPRIALIITNQNYSLKELELQNPHADGDLLKAALEAVDFDVTVVRDTAHRGELEEAIGKYVARLAEAGPDAVGFFYYSGHGAADGPRGRNYLLPTGPKIDHAAQLRLSAVSVETIVNALAEAGGKMNFVVFDACRNVPLKRPDKSNYKGFAPYRDAPGMLIAYATEPGDVAADENHYSRALAEEIVKPNREAGSVFRAVSGRVFQATGGHQRPVPVDKRFDDFYFKPAVGIPAQLPRVSAQPACYGVEVDLANGGRECVAPGSGESFRDCPDCPAMVVVPSGSFDMGSRETEVLHRSDENPERDVTFEELRGNIESPRHEVTISKPFAVGKFEVTFAEWDACVAEGGCKHKPEDAGWGRADRPVINVSWDDISKEYLPWLRGKTGKTYRLLSEAEWEYAARAATARPFSFDLPITPAKANYDGKFIYGTGVEGESRGKTVPVKSFDANPWGLYQVHGNVWEWVQDCYVDSYKDAPGDGGAAKETSDCDRVNRGGSWRDSPDWLRSASRSRIWPDVRSNGKGFRVARTL